MTSIAKLKKRRFLRQTKVYQMKWILFQYIEDIENPAENNK